MLNCNTNKKFSLTFLSILLFFTFCCKERVIEIERSSIFIYAYPTEGKSPLSVKFYASIAYSDKFEIIWDFGDGSSEKTTVPYVEHTYKVSEETVFVVSATLVTGKSIAKSYTTKSSGILEMVLQKKQPFPMLNIRIKSQKRLFLLYQLHL